MIRLVIGSQHSSVIIDGARIAQPQQPTPDQETVDLLWRLRRDPSSVRAWQVGMGLWRWFLAGPAGAALAAELGEPGRHRLAIEVTDERFADLPWETLLVPGLAEPLAVQAGIDVYRTVPADAPVAAPAGPLRILAVVASPGHDGPELLDYERELGRILDAVEPGRHEFGTQVRILEWGSAAAIRAALAEQPWHVLHISCHARPGTLLLETEAGGLDEVDAARFRTEVLPPERSVPLIVLAGCSTALADRPGLPGLPGLARGLLGANVPAVLAMTAPVGDVYATELCARFYGRLTEQPDVLTAFADVRRDLAHEAGSPEWVVPALFLARPDVRLVDGTATEPVRPPEISPAGAARRTGDFVGRRDELRRLSRVRPGVLLHGIGGVGKTSLATELAARAGCPVVAVSGRVAVDMIMAALRRTLLDHVAETDPARRLVTTLADGRLDWRDRLAGELPELLLVLDNAEDNLADDHTLADPELAEFLARWTEHGPLLITSRHPFPVPGIEAVAVGPLSWQETRKLMWRLPGIDALTSTQRRLAWHRLGGHPRSLEYLDALLRDGVARFDDVTDRLATALAGRGVDVNGEFTTALAETAALVADDVLLPALVDRLATAPLAHDLLLGAAVYRQPVDRPGLAWQVGDVHDIPYTEHTETAPITVPDGLDDAVDTLTRLGLLAPADGGHLVHRWTAATLARLAGADRLRDAHARAGDYWAWHLRLRGWTDLVDVAQMLEARYHYLAAGDIESSALWTSLAAHELHVRGSWAWAEHLCAEGIATLPPRSDRVAGFRSLMGTLRFDSGDIAGAEAAFGDALAMYTELGQRSDVATMQHQLGLLAQHRGDWDRAAELYRACLAVKEEFGDRAAIGISYHQFGMLAENRGDRTAAEEWFRKALALSEETDDRDGVATAQHQLGILAQQAGDLDRAEHCFRTALAHYRRVDDRALTGMGHTRLAAVALARYHYDTAQQHVRAAQVVFEELGAARNIAECQLQLGQIARDQGDFGWAERCYATALALYESLGDPGQVAHCRLHVGIMRVLADRPADAVVPIATAYLGRREMSTVDQQWLAALYRELGERAFADALRGLPQRGDIVRTTRRFVELEDRTAEYFGVGSGYLRVGRAAADQNEHGAAWSYFGRALAAFEQAGDLESMADCHDQLGMARMGGRYLDHARKHYQAALAINERRRDPVRMAVNHHQLGRVEQERKDYPAAERHYQASIDIKRRMNNLQGVSNSTFQLGVVAMLRGDHDRAEQRYQECLAIDQRLGDPTSLALDYGNLGNLHNAVDRPDKGIPLVLRALSINMKIGSSNAVLNINELRKQRARLGEREFTEIITATLDADGVRYVLELTALLPSGSGGRDL